MLPVTLQVPLQFVVQSASDLKIKSFISINLSFYIAVTFAFWPHHRSHIEFWTRSCTFSRWLWIGFEPIHLYTKRTENYNKFQSLLCHLTFEAEASPRLRRMTSPDTWIIITGLRHSQPWEEQELENIGAEIVHPLTPVKRPESALKDTDVVDYLQYK